MKKIISNKEIIEKAEKWIASFTHDEFSKMLKEEIYLNELNEAQNLEWLNNGSIPIYKGILPTEYIIPMIKDKRKFIWTLSGGYHKNIKINIPNSSVESFLNLEAA